MDPLRALIDRLYARGVYSEHSPPWPLELADALWLATFLPAGESAPPPAPASTGDADAQPPGDTTEPPDTGDEPEAATTTTADQHPPPGPSRRRQGETAEVELRIPEGPRSTADPGGAAAGGGSAPGPGATTLRVARPGLLPDPLGIGRALRPLLQRLPSRGRRVLDEPATVHNFAELRLPVPVLRGTPERRWELAVVIDNHPSTVLWQPLLAELTELLSRHGAFRDLRLWRLDTAGSGPVRLWPGAGRHGVGGVPRSPKVLLDPLGRRAVLVVSDFSAAGWRRGRSLRPQHAPQPLDVLADWQRSQPVVVLHLMPPARWPRSAFGAAELVALRAAPPAAEGAVAGLRLDTGSAASARPGNGAPPLILPVIGTDPPSLSAWARLVAGRTGAMLTGVRFPAEPSSRSAAVIDPRTAPRPPEPPEPRERLRRFMAGASEPARALVLACAGVPLTLPVVRLVQEAAGIDPNPAALAELFLTGLVRPTREQPSADPSPLERIYDFPPGVRQLLIDQSDPAELRDLLRRIGRLIERRLGSTRDFLARWLDPDRPVDTGGAKPLFEPFARIRLQVLRRLGGHYLEGEAARLAAWLERPDTPPRPDLLLLAETHAITDALLATYRERFGPAGREPEQGDSSKPRSGGLRRPAQQPQRPGRKNITRILVVDDHPLVRVGLREIIKEEPDLTICAEAGSVRVGFDLARAQSPDLVLVDISLEDGSGIDLLKRLRVHDPHLKMLVCSMHDESLFAERAINAGARGYVSKHQVGEQFVCAIRQVLAGRIYLSDRMLERVMGGFDKNKDAGPSGIEGLSDREIEVFSLIGQGLSTLKIAERLHLSIKTVETHREKIKRKLQLATGGELVREAVRWHIEQA